MLVGSMFCPVSCLVVSDSGTPRTIVHQILLSMEFSRPVGSIPILTVNFPNWRGLQYLQNSSKILLCVSVDEEIGPYLNAALDCFSLPSLPKQLFESEPWNFGKVMEAE